jgi:hypothetical protein
MFSRAWHVEDWVMVTGNVVCAGAVDSKKRAAGLQEEGAIALADVSNAGIGFFPGCSEISKRDFSEVRPGSIPE